MSKYKLIETEEPNIIEGMKINRIYTLGSMYDHNCLAVEIDEQPDFRIDAETVLKMVNEFSFDLERKRKYTYLINPKLLEDK